MCIKDSVPVAYNILIGYFLKLAKVVDDVQILDLLLVLQYMDTIA